MRLAVIPARGGSKRIPHKNRRDFAGKPIISYSISAARESGLFDRIVVSTDDPLIAGIAEAAGAEVPFVRPAGLADDFCGTDDVVRHAIAWLDEQGARCDHVCCIYPTAPLLDAASLRRGWDELQRTGKRFAFSVAHYAFPIQRALRRTNDGGVELFHPEFAATRSQDLEPALHDAAQFYWGDAQAFRDGLESFAPHSAPVILPRWMVMDIDTPEDWEHAELLYRALRLTREEGAK